MKINVLFFAVVLAGAGILSCNKVDKVSAPKTEKKGITIPSIGRKGTVGGTVKGWRQYTKRDDSLMMLDANLVLHGIARKQFRNLDAFVKEFDRHYTGGKTYRSEFYRKFQYYDDYNHVDAGKYHEQYRSNLQEWCDLNPDAGAPSIAMAGYEIYLAWYARGNGFSDTVTKSGWEKFYSHINRAKEILENAPEASKQDPHYYSLLITIHLASGSSIKDVQSVFEAGQNVEPTYINLYLGMTNYLQPKWYGSNFDDWVKWLDESLKHSSLSDEEKLVIYGTVVRSNVRGVECPYSLIQS